MWSKIEWFLKWIFYIKFYNAYKHIFLSLCAIEYTYLEIECTFIISALKSCGFSGICRVFCSITARVIVISFSFENFSFFYYYFLHSTEQINRKYLDTYYYSCSNEIFKYYYLNSKDSYNIWIFLWMNLTHIWLQSIALIDFLIAIVISWKPYQNTNFDRKMKSIVPFFAKLYADTRENASESSELSLHLKTTLRFF